MSGERDDGGAVGPACVTEHRVASKLQRQVSDQHDQVALLFEQMLAGSVKQIGYIHRWRYLGVDQTLDLPIDRGKSTEKILEKPRAYSSVSKDGGRNWSPAKEEPDLWNARSKGFYGLSETGAHVNVYNDGPAMPAYTPSRSG